MYKKIGLLIISLFTLSNSAFAYTISQTNITDLYGGTFAYPYIEELSADYDHIYLILQNGGKFSTYVDNLITTFPVILNVGMAESGYFSIATLPNDTYNILEYSETTNSQDLINCMPEGLPFTCSLQQFQAITGYVGTTNLVINREFNFPFEKYADSSGNFNGIGSFYSNFVIYDTNANNAYYSFGTYETIDTAFRASDLPVSANYTILTSQNDDLITICETLTLDECKNVTEGYEMTVYLNATTDILSLYNFIGQYPIEETENETALTQIATLGVSGFTQIGNIILFILGLFVGIGICILGFRFGWRKLHQTVTPNKFNYKSTYGQGGWKKK